MLRNYEKSWESPRLDYYWHHNFVHQIYSQHILEKYLLFQEKSIIAINSHDSYTFYIERTDYDLYVKKFYLSSNYFFDWLHAIDELQKIISALPWCTCSKSVSQLFKTINYYEGLFHHAVALHYVSQPHFTNCLHKELLAILSKRMTPQRAELLIRHYSTPEELPNVIIEQLEWFDIVMRQPTGFDLDRAIQEHLKKWKYITAGDSKAPMNQEYLKGRFEKDSVNLTGIALYCDTISKSYAKKDLSLFSNQEREYIKKLQIVSFRRFCTKAMWMKLWYLLEQNLLELQTQLNIPEIFQYTLKELQDGTFLKEDNRKTYVYISTSNKYDLYYNGLDYSFLRDSAVDFSQTSKLVGEIGYKGDRVTGRVVKVDWNDDVNKKLEEITDNTILVLPQVLPAYVGLLFRCKGLVVDEGGITGHASIIARELKIPSIIGVKHATKVFNDGDSIILDFDNQCVEKIMMEDLS